MEWYRIAMFVVALISIIAIVYQYIKLRRYLKGAEGLTVEQAEPQIRKHIRNVIIWMVLTFILVISGIVAQSVSLLGEILGP